MVTLNTGRNSGERTYDFMPGPVENGTLESIAGYKTSVSFGERDPGPTVIPDSGHWCLVGKRH